MVFLSPVYANRCELETRVDTLIIGEHTAIRVYFVYKCTYLKANTKVFNGFRKKHFTKVKCHLFNKRT